MEMSKRLIKDATEVAELKVDGRRYALEAGRMFKVRGSGNAGVWKVKRILVWEDGYAEVVAWWVQAWGQKQSAQWRACRVDQISKISRVVTR